MRKAFAIFSAFFVFSLASCSKEVEVVPGNSGPDLGQPDDPFTPANLEVATWVPNVSGVSPANKKGTITTFENTITATTGLLRLDDPWLAAKEVSVNIGTFEQSDFGPNGSLTLTAKTKNYPIAGGAYPVLISLQVTDNGVTTEWVNTRRAGTSNDCRASGMFVCSGGGCDQNPSCTVDAPSSYSNRDDWEQHQVFSLDYISVNSFPRCERTTGPWSNGDCNATISGPLPAGTYVAKYILLSDLASDVSSINTQFTVDVLRKKDTSSRDTENSNGAIKLNIILVGQENISASETAKGQQNLNLLFEEVQNILSAGLDVQFSEINAYEWDSDEYQDVDYLVIHEMFGQGSLGLPAEHQDNAINVFLVSSIPYSNSGFTILGLAGGIGGPTIAGTGSSGLAFSSMGEISTFNPSCTIGSCARSSQEEDFLEMGATIAHELGHYLGLNHPSERKASAGVNQRHDQLTDTPKTDARLVSGVYYLDAKACTQDATNTLNGQTCNQVCPNYFVGNTPTNFCPTQLGCQFNHIMWYTTKNRSLDGGVWYEDGSLFSDQSKALTLWSPLVL